MYLKNEEKYITHNILENNFIFLMLKNNQPNILKSQIMSMGLIKENKKHVQ